MWLQVPPEVLAARMRERGEARDAGAVATTAAAPAVPHLSLDATLDTAAQADLVPRGG